jgi:hypothetical protein
VPARSTANYCSATCRSIARRALGRELAGEHDLGQLKTKVEELAISGGGLAHGYGQVTPAARRDLPVADRPRRLILTWLIKLVHESAPASARSRFPAGPSLRLWPGGWMRIPTPI